MGIRFGFDYPQSTMVTDLVRVDDGWRIDQLPTDDEGSLEPFGVERSTRT